MPRCIFGAGPWRGPPGWGAALAGLALRSASLRSASLRFRPTSASKATSCFYDTVPDFVILFPRPPIESNFNLGIYLIDVSREGDGRRFRRVVLGSGSLQQFVALLLFEQLYELADVLCFVTIDNQESVGSINDDKVVHTD